MSRVLAIADLTIRAAIRSRIFLFMTGILLMVIVALPGSLKSDGTLQGHVQIMLHYTIGATFIILLLTTLWSSCAAVSQEVQSRTLHQIISKPVHGRHIWLGKWLGVCLLNGALLVIAGTAVYVQLHVSLNTQHQQANDQHISWVLDGHISAPPLMRNSLKEDVNEIFISLANKGNTAIINTAESESAINEVKREIRDRVLTRPLVIAPGRSFEWMFSVADSDSSAPPFLSFQLMPSGKMSNRDMQGSFALYSNSETTPFAEIPFNSRAGRKNRISIDTPEKTETLIRVVLTNTEPDGGESLVFSNETSILINQHNSLFVTNLLRSLLILFFKLCLVAAIGVTCGCIFALPVAGFTAAFILCLPQLTGILEESINENAHNHHGHSHADHDHSAHDNSLENVYLAINKMTKPLHGYHPLELLPRGTYIPWKDVFTCGFWFALVYSAVSAVIGVACFQRREIGLI